MEIDFKDIRTLTRRLEKAAGGGFKRGMRRAFFSTLRASKTEVKRAIVKTYNLSQKRASQDLKTGKVDPSNLRFSVYGDRKPVGLASFSGTSHRKSGVSARIMKVGGRTIYKGAWLGHGLAGERQGGGKLALRRVPGSGKRRMKKGRYAGSGIKRQPIEALQGPSVGAMLENDKTVDRLVTFAAGKYTTELERQIKVAIRG